MKKLLNVLLLCAFFGFLSTSCSKDDEDDFLYPMSTLYGTWEGTHVDIDGKWVDITSYWYEKYQFSITFYDDGDYYGRGYFGTGRGTYKAKGDVIYTYVDGKPYYNYRIMSLENDLAELEMYGQSGDSIRIRVKKKL